MSVSDQLSSNEVPAEPVFSPASCAERNGRMLHVLTLTPFYPLEDDDGAGCFVAEPFAALRSAGTRHSVIVATPFYRAIRPISRAAEPATSVKYFSFPKGLGLASAGLFLWRRIAPLVRGIHQQTPVDLMHAHGALPCGHAALLLSAELGIPYVVTVHGLDAYSTRQVGGVFSRWCAGVSQNVYQGARRIICISQRVRDEVQTRGEFSTEVVYNGVDAELFSPGVAGDGGPVVLAIGNLIPTKGHDTLLRAVAAVGKEFPALRCEIVGDGAEREKLSKLARDLNISDKVTFLGRISRREVAEALRRCALFALPSRYEALGCVYLEAMATGKAVLACRGQGIEEIIESGRNGFLVEPDNPAALAEMLTRLLRNPVLRERMAAAGQSTVRQRLTLWHQAENLARIYAECAQ